MSKHRAPRYLRTKKVIARAPVAAGATVIGLGVFGSPVSASAAPADLSGSTEPYELPDTTAAGTSSPPQTYQDATDSYGRHASADGTYTVVRGDTVSRIAADFDQPWRELYQRNVSVIGANPDLIFPGEVLALTGAVTPAPAAQTPAPGGTAGDSAPLAAPAPAADTAPAPAPAPAADAAPVADAPAPAPAPEPAPAPAPAPEPAPAPAPVVAPAPAPVAAPAPAPVAAPAPAPVAAPAPAPAPLPAAIAHITNTAGPIKPAAQAAANAVVSNVPGAGAITLGGTRASAVDPHGHPSGLAIDYMVMSDTGLGNAIVQYTIDHWDSLGVEYVIYQQRILMSPGGAWQQMEDRGSATANHMDHVHINYVG